MCTPPLLDSQTLIIRFRNPLPNITVEVVAGAVACGMIWGITIEIASQPYVHYVERAEAHEEPVPVRLEVIYNWDEERVKQEISSTFPEDPYTAIAIAGCESGFKMIQSHHMQPYGREESWGIFQIHKPAWDATAKQLGLENYQTDIRQNLQMARHIYDSTGGWHHWSCLNHI